MNNSGKNPWERQKSPPNLDEMIANFFKKLFKGNQQGGDMNSVMIGILILVITSLWAVSGVFTVQPGEQAVILRFGEFSRFADPGIHWIPNAIDSKYIVNVKKINKEEIEEEMLTKDENYAVVKLAVFYKINNPLNFLFNADNPRHILSQTIKSALRHVVGHSTLDDILTKERDTIKQEIEGKVIDILKLYKIGIEITDVKIVDARPPDGVREAFDEVVKAREEEQRTINLAKAYENNVIPVAKGKANRLINEAQAYQERAILNAKSEIAKYVALLPQYKQHPEITRFRVYMSGLDPVLKKTHKVVLSNKQNLSILSLSKLLEQGSVK